MWDPNPWTKLKPSFPGAMTAPTMGPCDPPLVCVEFNASYVPFVAGACSQLTQRLAWLADNDDVLNQILANMSWLVEVIGTAVQCQQPPMIPGQPTDQRACNIAGYLAHFIIRQSVAQAVQGVDNEMIAVDFLWIVLRFIPEFSGVFAITTAVLPQLFSAVQSAGTAHFQSALDDPVLWGTITCAIFDAIRTDGQVTGGNYPTVVANIDAISFASSDVHDAIVGFVTGLGPGGMQGVQTAGAMTDYDCSGCGTGPALGPVGPAPARISLRDTLQIAVGAADAALPILFPATFSSVPTITVGVDNQDLIASFTGTSTTGTTLMLTAAAPVLLLTTGTIDWTAEMPGGS